MFQLSSLKLLSARALVAFAVVLVGCSKQIVSRDILSPDGRLILRIEVNESGGAAVPDVTSGYILLSGSSAAHEELIFKGSAVDSFNAAWRTPEVVSLSFSGGYISQCNKKAVMSPKFKITVLGCR
jgi:hypothetical protein